MASALRKLQDFLFPMAPAADSNSPPNTHALPGPDDIDIIVDGNKRKAWMLHRKPLPMQDDLAVMRYDTATNQFTLIGTDGSEIQLSTITVVEALRRPLRLAPEIALMQSNEAGEIGQIRVLPLEFAE